MGGKPLPLVHGKNPVKKLPKCTAAASRGLTLSTRERAQICSDGVPRCGGSRLGGGAEQGI
jgi:hypothetical protein